MPVAQLFPEEQAFLPEEPGTCPVYPNGSASPEAAPAPQPNPIHEIRKVMRFLDKDLSEEVLKKIVHLSSFDQMKDNPMANFSAFPSDVVDQSQYKFMRKGKVGDWKSHFTVQQNEMFEEKYQQQMHGSAMKFRYDI